MLFERIKKLADAQGKSINDVENDLKYSQNTLYRLKRSNPSATKLEELANYFQVSTDYLLGRTDYKNVMSINETTQSYDTGKNIGTTLAAHAKDRNHEITPEETDRIIAYLDGIIDADQNKK